MPCLMYGPAKTSAITLLPFVGDETVRHAFDELYQFLVSFSARFPAARAAKCEIDALLRDSDTALSYELTGAIGGRGSEYS